MKDYAFTVTDNIGKVYYTISAPNLVAAYRKARQSHLTIQPLARIRFVLCTTPSGLGA